MNCQEFWNTLPDNGVAHPHLLECAICAARMRKQGELAAGLRSMAEQQARIEAPSRVEARLVAAFRAQSGMPVGRTGIRRWIPAATWAAALAAMIAMGIFLVRERETETRQNAPHRVEVAAIDSGGTDVAADDGFLPLPGAAQLVPADDVNVVHVELPRSAMMQVGIEVNPDRAGETVRADVMVGADGLARAVRFVDSAGSD
jgi:hypothetical protein